VTRLHGESPRTAGFGQAPGPHRKESAKRRIAELSLETLERGYPMAGDLADQVEIVE
jgi:hypothetical protein